MDYQEFDEAEMKKRKQDQIAWRNQKRTTNLFTFLMTIIEIVVTLAVILVLFLATAKICFTAGDANEASVQKLFLILMVVVFFLGLFLGFLLFKMIARWSIKHFKLEDKLTNEVLNHYLKTRKDIENERKAKR